METITLDYNPRNVQAQKALDYIFSLGVFKVQNVEKMHRKDSNINHVKTHSAQVKDPFAGVRGIWADRDVDARALRNEAWKIKND